MLFEKNMLKKNIPIIITTGFRNHTVVYLKKNALEITLDSRSAARSAGAPKKRLETHMKRHKSRIVSKNLFAQIESCFKNFICTNQRLFQKNYLHKNKF
jgi:hypothetical protein